MSDVSFQAVMENWFRSREFPAKGHPGDWAREFDRYVEGLLLETRLRKGSSQWVQDAEDYLLCRQRDLAKAIPSATAWEFITPLEIVELALALLRPDKQERIASIGSGLGTFLLLTCLRGAHNGSGPRPTALGVESDPALVGAARSAARMLGLDVFFGEDLPETYQADLVFAHPRFGTKGSKDLNSRLFLQIHAWLTRSLAPGGEALLLVPSNKVPRIPRTETEQDPKVGLCAILYLEEKVGPIGKPALLWYRNGLGHGEPLEFQVSWKSPSMLSSAENIRTELDAYKRNLQAKERLEAVNPRSLEDLLSALHAVEDGVGQTRNEWDSLLERIRG